MLQHTFGMQVPSQLIMDYKSAVTIMVPAAKPAHAINQMTILFGWLANNGIMISETAQAMTLLTALPHKYREWATQLLFSLDLSNMTFVSWSEMHSNRNMLIR